MNNNIIVGNGKYIVVAGNKYRIDKIIERVKNMLKFSEIENSEIAIGKRWNEFREALAANQFSYTEIEKAKELTFLKAYDDLFNGHSGIDHKTTTIKELKGKLGRGTILSNKEVPIYERFLPKEEFITDANRFSPRGVEWLYLAIGEDNEIHECAQAECRVKNGDRFGFCHFEFNALDDDCKLVDLTIADDKAYAELNHELEIFARKEVIKAIKSVKTLDHVPKISIDPEELKKILVPWSAYTYTKLLSEQIFIPLDVSDSRVMIYAPFQTMAQYYISLGYSGIIYGSTVCSIGKNIVLFGKDMASPIGEIEDYTIS